jgi:uncharacterized protein (TIGR03083 family)
MSTTSDLLEELAASRATLLASFAGLSDEQLARKSTIGEWSIKDALGHVAAWESMVTGFLPQRLDTGTFPALAVLRELGDDPINAIEVAEREALSPREQLEELDQARTRLVASIRALGDTTLARTRPWPEWEGTLAAYIVESICGHEREHTEAIRAAANHLRASS